MIDASLTAGADTVLAFPNLNQPCFPVIVKMDGKRFVHHIEIWRRLVKKLPITKIFLPCVPARTEDIPFGYIAIAERSSQRIKQLEFVAGGHTAKAAEDFSFPPKVKQSEQAKENDYNTKKIVHTVLQSFVS